MKNKFLLFALLLGVIGGSTYAQKEFNVSQVTVVNVGDGRLLFREKENEKPLFGEFRLIDGYRTEYILAEFADGMYNGSYKSFKYNKLSKKGNYWQRVVTLQAIKV